MSAERIAIRYAKPLIELAEEKNVLDEVKKDMASFSLLCKENRAFSLMLKSPIIPHLKKSEILKKIFTNKVNDLTLMVFDLMTRKSREGLLELMANEFVHLYHEKKGFIEATVTTSFKLDDSLEGTFEKLTKEITGKEPILAQKVDPEIIGGYVLRFGDSQIDDSVLGQLKELKLKFSNK